MTKKIIHGYNVEYDEGSDILKAYLEHLELRLSHEEFKAIFENAFRSDLKKTHLEDKYDNKFTLVYTGENNCLLRKREI